MCPISDKFRFHQNPSIRKEKYPVMRWPDEQYPEKYVNAVADRLVSWEMTEVFFWHLGLRKAGFTPFVPLEEYSGYKEPPDIHPFYEDFVKELKMSNRHRELYMQYVYYTIYNI